MSDDTSSDSDGQRGHGAASHPTLGDIVRDWLRSIGRSRNGDPNLRESLEELIDEHDHLTAPIDPEERLMLMNILKFGELRVHDVMVPRADIVGLEISTPIEEVIELFRSANHSRVPVYREMLDDVVGMVHIKDLFRYWGQPEAFDLGAVARKLLFVPPSMPVLDLLLQMRASRIHMALVVDEYGGIDGLVTIEDLVEEIVGEIEDEHDIVERPRFIENPDGSYDADARVEIEEFERLVGCELLPEDRDEEVDTLGGLVFSLVGRVPRRGEVIDHPSGLVFEIVDADPRRIKSLRVRRRGRRIADVAADDRESKA